MWYNIIPNGNYIYHKKEHEMSGIVTSTVERINYETGEVVERENVIVKKSNNEEFVRFFIDSIDKITGAKLTGTEHNVLYMIQKYTINNSNLLFYNKQTREQIAKDLKVESDTVRKCVDRLVKKGLIERPERGMYYLNPIHFGRGDWKSIRRLRKEIIYEYDFESLEASRHDRAVAAYEEEEDLIEAEIESSEVSRVDAKTTEITHTVKRKRPSFIGILDGKIGDVSAKDVRREAALRQG